MSHPPRHPVTIRDAGKELDRVAYDRSVDQAKADFLQARALLPKRRQVSMANADRRAQRNLGWR